MYYDITIGFEAEHTAPSWHKNDCSSEGAYVREMAIRGNATGMNMGDEQQRGKCYIFKNNMRHPMSIPGRGRRRVLLSTDIAFMENFLPSLAQNPNIELRLITDEPSALLAGTNKIPHYMDVMDGRALHKNIWPRKWLRMKAAELCEWADMLIVAPIEAGTLGSMLSGLTSTLTLALLRGWDSTKPVIFVPGMTQAEWHNPLSVRQLKEVRQHWPQTIIISPLFWKFASPEEMVQIPWEGTEEFAEAISQALGLASAAEGIDKSSQDASVASIQNPKQPQAGDTERSGKRGLSLRKHLPQVLFPNPPAFQAFPMRKITSYPTIPTVPTQPPNEAILASLRTVPKPEIEKRENCAPSLPLELWLSIFEDHLNDWEIARAVGIPARLPVPKEWQANMSAPASLEYTILTGSFAAIKSRMEALPRWKPLSDLACHLIFKFSRTDILTYLSESHLDLFCTTSLLAGLPYCASVTHGNTSILQWWRDSTAFPAKNYGADAIDGASRAGFLSVLEWWRTSGLPLRYTERALESASAEGRVAVLEWWRNTSTDAPASNPIPLKVGKSVLLAAQSGSTASLAWWDTSGIPYAHSESVARIASTHGHVHVLDFWHRLKGPKIIFDNQVLVGATRNGHNDVLEWWRRSGLRVEFKTCDIEEALEDADPVSGAMERVRCWWARNGLNLGVGTSEWMKVKVL